MTDLLRLMLEIWKHIWPFRVVAPWQIGVYYVWGHYWRNVGNGIWPVVPYFTHLAPVTIVPTVFNTPLQTITTADNQTLAFSASITARVVEPAKALNAVDLYHETTVELVSGILAEEMVKRQAKELQGSKPDILIALKEACNRGTIAFGVAIEAIRFPTFAFVKTLRLLNERATLNQNAANQE